MSKDNLYEIVFYNDHTTPYQYVVGLICDTLGYPKYKSEELTERINKCGKLTFGPYQKDVAEAIESAVGKRNAESGHAFTVESVSLVNPKNEKVISCSFCGKASTSAHKMFAGNSSAICDACVVTSFGVLQSQLDSARLHFCYQLLDWHFGDLPIDNFVKTSRSYPGRVRADLQLAVDELFNQKAIRAIGIKQQYAHEKVDLTALWTSGRQAVGLAPISYEELEIGELEPIKCQINGLWLLQENNERYAVILSRLTDYSDGFTIMVEVSGPQGEATADISRSIFARIEQIINEARTYRGKVLSLERSSHYSGRSEGISVHNMAKVTQDQIILQKGILDELERTVIRFCEQREQLRQLGMSTKRGILFYGPPGTGKTHTVRFLASRLQGHTTFLITAEQIGLLPEYFALARLMQPVIFVIEDADLLAKARESMHDTGQEVLLNHLLNEMDGLKDDADILFILTTNKPEVMEEALIARPGRIDQLIEFPKPDESCRLRLIDLYKGNMTLDEALTALLIAKTDGVTASFIKELMRRLAQYAIERNGNGEVAKADIDQALTEMLFSNKQLNRSILGVT